jgi:predicted AAA+ superfamily ATPase
MTGKTVLLNQVKFDRYYNLLDPELEIQLRGSPKVFWDEIASLPEKSRIVVDEIQRVPALLDYAQMAIEKMQHQFLLSGSSARKLKRNRANLLGGRAADLRIHALTAKELGEDFSLPLVLSYGSLPKISTLMKEENIQEAQRLLRSYYTTYIKEEIQAEALVRKLEAFQRFLQAAAQSNAQMIEFANVSRECSVHMNTVKDYYQILEDTLIGSFLWPWNRSERKKARPKFYFFDCGVTRVLQNRLTSAPSPDEIGFLFETWFVNELIRIRDYEEKEHVISLWREGEWELDVLIEGGHGPIVAFECKAGKQIRNQPSLRAFRSKFPKVPLYVVSMRDENARRFEDGTELLPWKRAIEFYRGL